MQTTTEVSVDDASESTGRKLQQKGLSCAAVKVILLFNFSVIPAYVSHPNPSGVLSGVLRCVAYACRTLLSSDRKAHSTIRKPGATQKIQELLEC